MELKTWETMVVIDPDICNGKPVLRGKRITVQTILELSAGENRMKMESKLSQDLSKMGTE